MAPSPSSLAKYWTADVDGNCINDGEENGDDALLSSSGNSLFGDLQLKDSNKTDTSGSIFGDLLSGSNSGSSTSSEFEVLEAMPSGPSLSTAQVTQPKQQQQQQAQPQQLQTELLNLNFSPSASLVPTVPLYSNPHLYYATQHQPATLTSPSSFTPVMMMVPSSTHTGSALGFGVTSNGSGSFDFVADREKDPFAQC